jgi:hypothetical protein
MDTQNTPIPSKSTLTHQYDQEYNSKEEKDISKQKVRCLNLLATQKYVQKRNKYKSILSTKTKIVYDTTSFLNKEASNFSNTPGYRTAGIKS